MKKIQLTIFLLFSFLIVNAQYLIIGDTTGYEVTEVEETFYPESRVTFDMDCDGIEDFRFKSVNEPGGGAPYYYRDIGISLILGDSIETKINHLQGNVDTLRYGDTISHNTFPNIWANWGYLGLYLSTHMGNPYTIYSDSVYLVFRKKEQSDTSYAMILYSNQREIFTIHKIISECSTPFTILVREGLDPNATIDSPSIINIPEETTIYPNPFRSTILINIDIENIKQVNLYDNTGRLLRQFFNTNRIDNLDFLPIGVYFLEIINVNNDRIVEKILKIDD